MLTHNVFFTLKDNSSEATRALVESCRKYLTDHPGTAFFAVGTLSDLDREVNDREFDVALHVIFASRVAHDAYQKHPRHLEFIAENKDSWKMVRVFDADC